jgi:hypothetical protein
LTRAPRVVYPRKQMHRAYELGQNANLNSIQVDFARTSAC